MAQCDTTAVSVECLLDPDRMAVRTLFLPSSLIMGGSERKTVRVVNALHRRGYSALLAYLNAPHTLLAEVAPGVPVHHFDREGKFSPAAAWRVARHLRDNRIGHVVSVNLYPLLYIAAAALLLPSAARPRQSVLINSTHFLDPREAAQMRLYAPLLRRADKLVFGCRYHQDLWVEQYGLDPARCLIIHNGVDEASYSRAAVDVSRAEALGALGVATSSFVVVTVGRLVGEKRQIDLVEAVGRLVNEGLDIAAVIVGEGPEAASLQAAIAQGGWQRAIKLAGMHRDVRPLLAAADAFSLNSSHETFSNAALEAMSMGLPAVMSDLPSAREMVEDGVNGALYPVGDVAALAARLRELASSPAGTQRMGIAARERIERHFTFERMVDAYEQLLRGIPIIPG